MELMKEVEDLKQKKRIAEVGRDMAIVLFHSRSTVHVTLHVTFERPFSLHNQTLQLSCGVK